MATKRLFHTGSIALTLVCALAFAAPASAQAPKDSAADLKRAREALAKYKDPIAAIHDGYFSTLGCNIQGRQARAGSLRCRRHGRIFQCTADGRARCDETSGPRVRAGRGASWNWWRPVVRPAHPGSGRPVLFGRPSMARWRDTTRSCRTGCITRPARLAVERQSRRHVFSDQSESNVEGRLPFEETAPKISSTSDASL
jgi:hypothetical protein